MSKQLAIAASVSVFAMAAFALGGGPAGSGAYRPQQTSATVEAAAPAFGQVIPALFDLIG